MFNALSKKIEKYARIDLNYVLSGAFWVTGGNIAAKVFSLILAYIFANYISKETYGLFKYITSTASLFLILSLNGINTSIIRSVSLGCEGVLKKGYKIRFKWSLLGSLAALAAGIYYLNAGNAVLGYSFLIVAGFFPFFDTPTVYENFLDGRKLFKERSLFNILTTAIYTVSMSATLYFTKNLYFIITVYFFAYVLSRNFIYAYVIKKYRPNSQEDTGWISYGKHLSVMDAMDSISNYIDRIILFNIAGPVQVAIYSFASAIPEQMKVLHSFIPQIGFPKWSATDPANLKKTLPRKMGLFFIESLLLTAAYIIAAPIFFKIFFPLYLDAVRLSQIYMLSFLSFAPTFIIPILQAKEKIKELYFFNTVSPITQIALLFAGGIYFGLWGIVIARVLGRMMMTVYALFLYRRI